MKKRNLKNHSTNKPPTSLNQVVWAAFRSTFSGSSHINNNPWFSAPDILKILPLPISDIGEEHKTSISGTDFLDTTAVWTLIASSQDPKAQELSSWLKTEVIPQLKTDVQVFSSEEFGDIRTVIISGEPWFVGKDVSGALEYKDTFGALKKHVSEEDKLLCQIDSAGQKRDVTVINESGLYSLILSSKLPSAKKFKRWVTSEVLPSIRRHGAYVTPETLESMLADPDFGIRLLTELKAERIARQKAEHLVHEQQHELDHKSSIIQGFADDISIPEKRDLINRIVRHQSYYGRRWSLLYREFKYYYHIDVPRRYNNYIEKNPKAKNMSMLDFVDKELHSIPELFNVAVKIFESDVNQLVEQLYSTRKSA